MNRLPYGTYKLLTPEQKLAHDRELRRRFRENHRKELNAKNAKYMRMWAKTKPFVVQCKYCGNDFNAPRRDRIMCPDCHQKAHERAQAKKSAIIARRNAKAYFMDKVAQLREKGLEQAEIGAKLSISQRTVSHLLLKMGMRTIKKHHRKQNI